MPKPHVKKKNTSKRDVLNTTRDFTSMQYSANELVQDKVCGYGVATISRLLQIIGLFCRI